MVNTTTPTTTGKSAHTTIEAALRQILLEVTPGIRPYSSESYLPDHLGVWAAEQFSASNTHSQRPKVARRW